jgi:hypothetical protein
MKRKLLAGLVGGCALMSACYDLDITAVQPAAGSAFTREEVLRKPELIELVVAGLFINFWGGATYEQPWFHLSVFGEEVSSSANSTGNFNRNTTTQPNIIWDVVKEPRVPFDNSLQGSSLFARDPWSNFYEANAAATEMPRLIKENNIKIIDPATGLDNTQRVLTFAKWLQGMSHIHLGMLFDSAAVITERDTLSKIPDIPFRPYREVVDSGIKWLEQAITMTKQSSFIFPLNDDLWIYNTAVTNDELAAISHSYIARAMVYSARTKAERDGVNWAEVKRHIELGTHAPFGPIGVPNPVITMDYRALMSSQPENIVSICNANNSQNGTNFCTHSNGINHAGVVRVDLRLLGPADTSGAYQQWLDAVSKPTFAATVPFIIRTPDKRIQDPSATRPLNKPTYFKYTDRPPPTTIMLPERGTYYWSNYWSSSRALNNHEQFPNAGGGRTRRTGDLNMIQDAMMLPVEMDLLLAEAEIHLNNPGAAAALINKTRVANGELPAVTATGVPQSAGCVPKLWNGNCGSLMDALMYEKRIETYGTGISFFDLRGWDCLLEGTLTELPPPARQLDLLNKPIYTYGGGTPGTPGNAARPINCPLLHKP